MTELPESPILQSISTRTQQHYVFGLRDRLIKGEIFATPYVSPITGAGSILIMGWDAESEREASIDIKALDGFGQFVDVYHVPLRALDAALTGKVRFANGGRFERLGNWDFPFYGERIGAWVQQVM
jgi:hypothetical protein